MLTKPQIDNIVKKLRQLDADDEALRRANAARNAANERYKITWQEARDLVEETDAEDSDRETLISAYESVYGESLRIRQAVHLVFDGLGIIGDQKTPETKRKKMLQEAFSRTKNHGVKQIRTSVKIQKQLVRGQKRQALASLKTELEGYLKPIRQLLRYHYDVMSPEQFADWVKEVWVANWHQEYDAEIEAEEVEELAAK